MQAAVVEAVAVEHAGPEILDHDVGLLEQLVHDLLAVGLGEVERDALLAAIEGHEEMAFAVRTAGPRTGALARVVAAVGILDLDDLGSHVRKDLRAERAGDHARKVDDADAGERRTA